MDIDKIIGHPLADKSAPTVWSRYFVNMHYCVSTDLRAAITQ